VRRNLLPYLLIAVCATAQAETFRVWSGSPDPAPPYDTWSHAAHTIQQAIDLAGFGDLVLVTNGTYLTGSMITIGNLPNRIAITNATTVRSVNGPGGTFIVGAGPVGPGAIRAAYVGPGARLEGFHISQGHTLTTEDDVYDTRGGGVFCDYYGVVSNCWITDNHAVFYGGGVYAQGSCSGSTGLVTHCLIWSNSAAYGGGVGSGAVLDSVVRKNTTTDGGGGVASCQVNRCVVTFNTAGYIGGGAFASTMRNCLIGENVAPYGGGVAGGSERPLITHCTIAGNLAFYGGGVYFGLVSNSIVYYNDAVTQGTNTYLSPVSYSCLTPDPGGEQNITAPPVFIGLAEDNARLHPSSPCIDKCPTLPDATIDLDNFPRPLDGNGDGIALADMGACEYVAAGVDTDGDGLIDAAEILLYKTDPRCSDTDWDGVDDAREIADGTDPLDASDHPLTITTEGLPTAMEMVAYTHQLQATNRIPPYTWALPRGYYEGAASNSYSPCGIEQGWQEDYGTWELDLPFPFEFYGNTYTQCLVDSDGALLFGNTTWASRYGENPIADHEMIAVLWSDLTTESPGDIYVDSQTNRICVTWAGWYWGSTLVRASVSLYPDGMIRMHYGPGNGKGGTIGVSKGDGSNYVTSAFSQSGSMDMADDVIFVPACQLPEGLTFSTNGTLSGIPLQSATGMVTFNVYDSHGSGRSKNLLMEVAANPNRKPLITSNTPLLGTVPMGEGTSCVFEVTATDPDGVGISHAWSLDDVKVGTNSPTYTLMTDWGDAGTYTLQCSVSDDLWVDMVRCQWTVVVTADNDGDGLPNACENEHAFLNPWDDSDADRDEDDDFLSNLEEWWRQTSMTCPDTDGDSLYDGWETRYGFDPLGPTGAVFGVGLTEIGRCLVGSARDVAIDDSHAYVVNTASGTGRLTVVSISNPDEPDIVAVVDGLGEPFHLSVTNNYAYVLCGTGGLHIVDVSDPADSCRMGGYTNVGYASAVAASAGYAYIADSYVGLQVIDVSDPTDCVTVGGCDTGGTAYDVVVAGTHAFVADLFEGLQVIDISDPSNCQIVGTCTNADWVTNVHLDGTRVYVSGYSSQLQIIDVSTPTDPVPIGAHEAGVWAQAILSYEHYVLLCHWSGVLGVDVSDPANCFSAGGMETPLYSSYGGCLQGDTLYLAQGAGGLGIYSIEELFDEDEDGMSDAWEVCFLGSDTNAPLDDWDNDGISNWGEYVAKLNPTNADQDADGVLDGMEVTVYNSDPRERDTDGDSMDDGMERIAGTSLTDPGDTFCIKEAFPMGEEGLFVTCWDSVTGRTYTVFGITNLLSTSWTNLHQASGNGDRQCFTNTDPSTPALFLKLIVEEP